MWESVRNENHVQPGASGEFCLPLCTNKVGDLIFGILTSIITLVLLGLVFSCFGFLSAGMLSLVGFVQQAEQVRAFQAVSGENTPRMPDEACPYIHGFIPHRLETLLCLWGIEGHEGTKLKYTCWVAYNVESLILIACCHCLPSLIHI